MTFSMKKLFAFAFIFFIISQSIMPVFADPESGTPGGPAPPSSAPADDDGGAASPSDGDGPGGGGISEAERLRLERIQTLMNLINDARFDIMQIEWELSEPNPATLEKAAETGVSYEELQRVYIEGFERFGDDWRSMVNDLGFREQKKYTYMSDSIFRRLDAADVKKTKELVEHFNSYQGLADPSYGRERKRTLQALTDIVWFDRAETEKLQYRLMEILTNISGWEAELYVLLKAGPYTSPEEKPFVSPEDEPPVPLEDEPYASPEDEPFASPEDDYIFLLAKEIEKDRWYTSFLEWKIGSIEAAVAEQGRYEDINFEAGSKLYNGNLRIFGDYWRLMFSDETFNLIITTGHLPGRTFYNIDTYVRDKALDPFLREAYNDFAAEFTGRRSFGGAGYNFGTRLPDLMEYELSLCEKVEREIKEASFPILPKEIELYELEGRPLYDIYMKQLECARIELEFLQEEYDALVAPAAEAIKLYLEYYAVWGDVWAEYIDKLYDEGDDGSLPDSPRYWFALYQNQYAEYRTAALPIAERIAELEKFIEDMLVGPVYKMGIHREILEVRAALAQARSVIERNMLQEQYPLAEYPADGAPPAEDDELRDAEIIADEYPHILLELMQELLAELMEDSQYQWWINHFGILEAHEKYIPFISYPEMDALFYDAYDEYMTFRDDFGNHIVSPTAAEFQKLYENIELYLWRAAEKKYQDGELLTELEMSWLRAYWNYVRTDVPPISEAEFLKTLPYWINVGLLSFAEALIGFFEIAAGTRNILYNGESVSLFDAFFQMRAFSVVFWGTTLIGMALALFFSIGKVAARATDLKAEKTMNATLAQIGKTMLAFLLVPFAMLASIKLVGVIMEQTDRAFDVANGAESVTRAVFTMSTLNAGRGELTGNMYSPERQKFLTGEYDYKDVTLVNEFFRIEDIDIGLSTLIACILIVMYIALICIFMLRMFYIVLLYVTSPLFVSSLAADDGVIFKKWRDLFISKLFTGLAIIISVKLIIYVLLPILNGDIRLTPEGQSSVIIKFVFVIGSVYAVYKSAGMVSAIIYPEGEADENMVLGAMKDKAFWAYKKAKEAAKFAWDTTKNAGKALLLGDATGFVKQAGEQAKKMGEKAAELAKQGGDKASGE